MLNAGMYQRLVSLATSFRQKPHLNRRGCSDTDLSYSPLHPIAKLPS